MLLAIDVGNTNIDLGVFDGHEVRASWRIASDVERLADEYAVSVLGLLRAVGLEPSAIGDAVLMHSRPNADVRGHSRDLCAVRGRRTPALCHPRSRAERIG